MICENLSLIWNIVWKIIFAVLKMSSCYDTVPISVKWTVSFQYISPRKFQIRVVNPLKLERKNCEMLHNVRWYETKFSYKRFWAQPVLNNHPTYILKSLRHIRFSFYIEELSRIVGDKLYVPEFFVWVYEWLRLIGKTRFSLSVARTSKKSSSTINKLSVSASSVWKISDSASSVWKV